MEKNKEEGLPYDYLYKLSISYLFGKWNAFER